MEVKDFKDEISKGLGSAILFLQNNPDKAHKYSKLILWACCHDTRYDSQCEAGRSSYLYEAICLSNSKEKLENDLLERLISTKRYRDVEQLFDIAEIMYENGNIRAKDAMYARFRDYLNRIQKIKVFSFNNSRTTLECATAGAISIIATDKFKGLEFVLDIMGSIIISKKIKSLFDIDWVMSYAKNELGEKNLNDFIQDKAKANENIKVIVEEYNLNEQSRYEYQKNRKPVLPKFESIISIVEKYCSEEKKRLGRRNILRGMGKKANEKELIKVAKELASTTDETKQIALLQVFINAAYPMPIDFLLRFSHNPNKVLAGAAVEVLENIKDERIHDLATELIKDKELSVYALGLFVQNFQNDYDLILDLLKKEHEQFIIEKSGFYFHSLTLGVRNIFKHNKSIESLDILHFLYQNTTCSHCRREIVQIMCDNNILPDRIAEEGRYDCDVDTREMIVEYLENIK